MSDELVPIEEPSVEEEAAEYHDVVHDVAPARVARVTEAANEDGTLRRIIRATKSSWVGTIIHLNGHKFDFSGRKYLLPIYDRPDRQILLKTARQVEKCCRTESKILLKDGREVCANTIRVGDRVAALDEAGHQTVDVVIGSEPNGNKPCLRIKTRLGSTLEVTCNHPLKKLLGWANAAELQVGDKVAALRTLGNFGTRHEPLAALLGLMTGDGCATDNAIRFTCKKSEVQEWFELMSGCLKYNVDSRSGTRNYYLYAVTPVVQYLVAHGLFSRRAHEKVLPEACFEFDRTSTRELLRGLWATDGHCKNVNPSKLDLVYCSTSPVLIRQVRLLLRKFGIITTQREYKPKNGRRAYIITVVTRRSLAAFHKELGPIPGKPFDVPTIDQNSNLDTLPKEIHTIVKNVLRSNPRFRKHGESFQAAGFRMNRQYCPTYQKIKRMQGYLQDQEIQKILDSDIVWDRIVSIDDIGVQPTWALQTKTQTYISDFVVNHNTTFLANNVVISSVIRPYNKALYVSPSHMQTRQFSNEKLKPAIEQSPLIKRYYQDASSACHVFEKGFTNGSYIFLRSAFRSADRTRGISARELNLDEIQDFIGSEIPVIMECTSHFPDAQVLMAGTPKSHDNPIEHYWQLSSQNEWMVKCLGCNHWNFLDDKNIGPTELYLNKSLPPGPVCKKCIKHIHVPDGQWMSFSKNRDVIGYRIPQLMVPWIISTDNQWRKLLAKRDTYPLGQLNNEVLGLSYDNASKPITRDELIQICDADFKMLPDFPTAAQASQWRHQTTFMGIDWGEGNDGSEKSPMGKTRAASYSVVTIGTYINQNQFRYVYFKKYTGQQADPDFVVKDAARLAVAYNIKLVGVDYGHGWGTNNALVRMLTASRVVQFQYLPKMKLPMQWSPEGFRYHVSRNFCISEFFFALKHGHIILPAWAQMEPFAKDILAIYTEYVEYRREMKYDHKPTEPDDSFHAMHFCHLAAKIHLGKVTRI